MIATVTGLSRRFGDTAALIFYRHDDVRRFDGKPYA